VRGVGDGPTKITPFVRSNSTDYSGSESEPLVDSYRCHREIRETDPADSNPGIEITSLSTTTTT